MPEETIRADVTTDEFRAYVLNLPPMEEDDTDESGIGEDPAGDAPADEDVPPADEGDDVDNDAGEQAGKSRTRRSTKSREPLSRAAIGDLHAQQVETTSREVERVLSRFFR